MKLTNEICISFLRGSGWLYNHDKQVIDDFVKKLSIAFNETNIKEYGFYPENVVRLVAGELKAGGENGV